jgi:hypothetical protein
MAPTEATNGVPDQGHAWRASSGPLDTRFLGLGESASGVPGIHSATQSIGFAEPCFPQLLRHTGARVLLRSGAVGNRQPVVRPEGIDLKLVRRTAYTTGDFVVA